MSYVRVEPYRAWVCVGDTHSQVTAKGVVWPSEDVDRSSTPTTDRESRCTVRKGGYTVCRVSPVTNDSDV
eukprot:660615-Prorocentrum_minimum.AAC.1